LAKPQYDMEQMILNIKRRCSVPTSQITFTDLDFTLLCNDEMQGEVVPLIMSTREEYFVDFVDILSPSTGYLPIPAEAVGAKLRSVCYVQQTSPLLLINLPRIDLDVVAGMGYNAGFNAFTGFYIQGNDLVLYPNNSVPTNTTIRLYYYKRTLVLAQPTAYGSIAAINTGTSTLTLDFVPALWAVDTQINAVSSEPSFNSVSSLMTITAVSSPSVVVDSVAGLSVGDFVSDYGYSAVPQVPLEAHGYLAQLTAVKCLEGLGDAQGMKAAQAKADLLKTALMVMVSQRVDGSVKKVMNPNGGLRLAAGLRRRW